MLWGLLTKNEAVKFAGQMLEKQMSLKGSAGRAILTEEGSVNRLGKKEPLRDSVFNQQTKRY